MDVNKRTDENNGGARYAIVGFRVKYYKSDDDIIEELEITDISTDMGKLLGA
jgi:hypothetical protein